MAETANTEDLRLQASRWSLGGDEHLLKVLQNMHQKLITKCQEVDSRMEEMTAALDDASISLQNVNNKFMALSNSQFIESRVYDDDLDVAADSAPVKQEVPPARTQPDVQMLKNSLAVLEQFHETVTIHDTDLDSDSEDDTTRVVLNPRDLYADRPLPYIIGSQAWKSKWHAGLLVEVSDSESATSKPDVDSEQYSDSESEPEEVLPDVTDERAERTISEGSELSAEQTRPVIRSQADIAADLARRLGGPPPQPVVPEPAPTSYVPEHTVDRIYKPRQPVPGAIFSDEPPPIEEYHSEESDQGDIFAELHKNQPYNNSNTERSRLAEDLFDFNKAESVSGDIFSDFANDKIATTPPAKRKSILFEGESEPELFAPQSASTSNAVQQTNKENGVIKKPVGGISLFGSNKGADSIGAAILRRNRRKSASTDDETDAANVPQTITSKRKHVTAKYKVTTPKESDKPPKIETQADTSTEKDIFDDLFAKPEKSQKKNVRKIEKDNKEHKKVDIFGDNLFDDIDDIFTSNVVKKEPSMKQKSLFNDEDDLFADIAVTKTAEVSKKISHDRGLFDSDDDLFSDTKNDKFNKNKPELVIQSEEKLPKTDNTSNAPNNTQTTNQVKSIFDDDSDTDIFSDMKKLVPSNNNNNSVGSSVSEIVINKQELSTNSEESEQVFTNNKNSNLNPSLEITKDKILRDTDVTNNQNLNIIDNSNVDNLSNNNKTEINSSLFDDTDELHSENNKPTNNNIENTDSEKILSPSSNDILKETKVEEDDADIPKDLKDSHQSNGVSNEDTYSEAIVQNENDITQQEIEQSIPPEDVFTSSTSDEPKETLKADAKDSNTKEDVFNDILLSQRSDVAEADIFNVPPIADVRKESIITSVHESVSNRDLLSDIFTEPPVFEKPKEPKKSQNVNALFDDDSDDEGLFFKKNDIDDVKPDMFQNNDMFDIFQDEPPAIDVDFTTKPKNTLDSIFDSDDDLFQIPKEQEIVLTTDKLDLDNKSDLDEDIFKESKQDKSKPETVSVKLDVELPIEKGISNSKSNSEIETQDNEAKKINKLKMNIKIDVNALLPGASPKKKIDQTHRPPGQIEEIDGQTNSTLLSDAPEPVIEEPVSETKIVKSVSFDGDRDSNILDNKLSKERAKIQVKRRPSTRRARKEAVRKSVIDLEDSTDNSSSIDDPPKTESNITESMSEALATNVAIQENIQVNTPDTSLKNSSPESNVDVSVVTKSKDVKSKIVYILNDEDIFNTKPVSERNPVPNKTVPEKAKLNILDDNDELFKQNQPQSQLKDELFTLGKSYENLNSNIDTRKTHDQNERVSTNKNKSSLFCDEDDDELFKSNKTVKKTNIINDDSDDDLFTGKIAKQSKLSEKTLVKGSLFGDDDEDGDLFGVKTKKVESMPQSIKPSTSRETKSTEPVFDDPLSLLGDDD